jgi:hypothetical protein
VVVQLEFDFLIEAGFLYSDRWPISLMKAIGQDKDRMFAALRPNPLAPDLLVASGTFVVQQRTFLVTFGTDKPRHDQGIFRVMGIQP